MPPNVIQQPQNTGIASIQQGLASLQQLGQFLEQKRQFEEDQARLNRIQDANWSWNAMQELVKTTDSKSLKDVAAKYPSMLSLMLQKGMGVDEATAMPWVTAIANSPYNADELFNLSHTMLNRYGSGEAEAQDVLTQTTAEVQKATQTQAQANAPSVTATVPPGGKTAAPKISMTPLGKTEGVPAEDTSLAEFKAKLQTLVGGMKVTQGILDPQQREQVDSLVGEYVGKSPAVDAFMQRDMGSFVSTVINAKGTLAEEALQRGKTVAQPPGPNYPPTVQPPASVAKDLFLNPPTTRSPTEQGTAGTGLPPSPVPTTTPSAQPAAETSAVADLLDEFLSGIDVGMGRGQVVLKRKRLEKALTPAVVAQMESNPQGVQALIENSNALLSDPMLARTMALQQNAPSVYATDLAATGGTAASKLDIAKKLLDLQKAGLDVQKARIDLARAGIEGKDAQNRAIVSGVVASMIQSGNVLPPEMATRLSDISTKMSAERDAWNKAPDKETKQFHLDQLNTLNQQFYGMIAAYKAAVAKQDTPEAKRIAALLDTVFSPKDKNLWERFWNVGNELARKNATQAPEAQKPTMTKEGSDLAKGFGLE